MTARFYRDTERAVFVISYYGQEVWERTIHDVVFKFNDLCAIHNFPRPSVFEYGKYRDSVWVTVETVWDI